MKQVMNYNKDNGLLNMIRRTDPMITHAATGKDKEWYGHLSCHASGYQQAGYV